MEKQFICYPAIIKEGAEKVFHASFPDIEDLKVVGKTIEEIIENAKEELGTLYLEMESNDIDIKDPSNPKDITLTDDERLIYINVNMRVFREKNRYKSITRAVTLPFYLNEQVKESGINVSAVLQEALYKKLDIKED